jgi:peptide/nickel transport system substrate-binding protein
LGVRRRCLFAISVLIAGCSGLATRRGATVVFASGADLQSINPLLTAHPLAKQVQRYVLLTTLVRYDSAMQITPYLARHWEWSPDSTALTLHLTTAVRWDDGAPTTARDAAWTLLAARDPATGYPRQSELAAVDTVVALDDSTLRISYAQRQRGIGDVLTDLAMLPAHLLDTIPHAQLRGAAWNVTPVGNGPFSFVSHQPNRRWVFAANPHFPTSLGGPPRIDRLVIAVVDEPTTKLAALTSGELDFAGIQPAHAEFVRRDPRLAVIEYPLLLSYAVVFNTRRAPFNDVTVRRAISRVLDRRTIVNGYLYGFGTPAFGPVATSIGDSGADSAARDILRDRHIQFELLTVGSGEAALEQMVQAQLAAAGIKVTIRQLELTSFLDRVQGVTHDFDAAVMGITGDPGLGQLAPLLTTTGITPPATIAQQLRLFADSVPAAFLYHARGVQGMNRRVLGVRMDLRGELPTITQWHLGP